MPEPKILFFDIETAPFKVWLFEIGRKIFISHEQIVEGSYSDIICICWKWRGHKKVHSLDWGIYKQNSGPMIDEFTKVIESADIAIAHNGKKFDVKHINTQRLLQGKTPIAWPTIEDTLLQMRKFFRFVSNRLDYVGKLLTGRGKKEMRLHYWTDIVNKKDPAALRKMIAYCKEDVRILEEVYEKAKVFFDPVVNASLLKGNGRYGCPRCGGRNIVRNGVRTTVANKYQKLRCQDCGTNFKGPVIQY